MTAYDSTNFDPPAPITHVTLINEVTGSTWPGVPMQLDTGADASLIPQVAVNRLGLIVSDVQYELASFDGTRTFAAAVQLKMQFGRYIFQGKYLLIDQEIGIIGRDILNLLPLLFDGPQLEWKVFRSEK